MPMWAMRVPRRGEAGILMALGAKFGVTRGADGRRLAEQF